VRDDAGCQPSRLSGLYCRSKVVEAPGRPTLPALVRPAPGRAGWCPARQPLLAEAPPCAGAAHEPSVHL